jgi:hypothetical protein
LPSIGVHNGKVLKIIQSATASRRGLTPALATMLKRYLLLTALLLTGAGGFLWYNSIYGWHTTSDPADEFGLEFRFLGCSEWPDDRPYETSIQSSVAGSSITYRISDPAGCGYSVRDPKYKLAGDTINLTYNLFTPSGEVAACLCEYKSEFRFGINPDAPRAAFSHTGG